MLAIYPQGETKFDPSKEIVELVKVVLEFSTGKSIYTRLTFLHVDILQLQTII